MKIVVLSRGPELYSTKRIVEEGKRYGHDIEVIDYMKCNLMLESGRPEVHFRGKNLTGVQAIIPRIGASATFYGAAVIRQFEMMNVFSVVSSQALVRSRDKLRSLQIMAKEGVGIPKTAFTNFSKETGEVINAVGGAPLVVKLLEGTQGLGVVLAETGKAAKSVIQAFDGLKQRIIVQEFIEEAKGCDVRAFVVGGTIIGAMKRVAKEGEFRSNFHQGASVEPVELTKVEKRVILKAAEAMRLGVAGVDLLQSERGPLILEVNSSPGLEGIEKATSANIAFSIIKFVEKESRKKRKTRDQV